MLQKEGLKQPESVKKATDEYMQDSNKIQQFVQEVLVSDPTGRSKQLWFTIATGSGAMKTAAMLRVAATSTKNFAALLGSRKNVRRAAKA